MAYGEFGGLLPRETHFSSPAAYTEAAKAEAFKRASYLSQMDSFYAQLAETTRQFDLNLAFQEKSLAENLKLDREKLAWEKEYGTGMLEIQREQNETQRYGIDKNYALGLKQVSLGQQELSLKSQQINAELKAQQEKLSMEKTLMNQMVPYLTQALGGSKASSATQPLRTSSILDFGAPSSYIATPSSSANYYGSLSTPGSYSYSYGGTTYSSASPKPYDSGSSWGSSYSDSVGTSSWDYGWGGTDSWSDFGGSYDFGEYDVAWLDY